MRKEVLLLEYLIGLNHGKESPFSLRTTRDDSSSFGLILSFRLHLKKIPQLMESYPQLIPNITKVVDPLKAFKGRHSHGEHGRK
jgi:hypothetical protein